ncbi:eukaryotic-like serine/threonine-protein kinase [Anaerolineae bacterium]|nr:eukaryotic-like serine/threonine-protein kinase [Anaerolineae bacterium]
MTLGNLRALLYLIQVFKSIIYRLNFCNVYARELRLPRFRIIMAHNAMDAPSTMPSIVSKTHHQHRNKVVAMPIAPGETVGPYQIIEPLGQGGMATVFKAYHPALDRYVAIKVLHPAFKEDPNFNARFNREARIVAKLDHPNIIPIYDFAEHAGTPYLVMRYVEGKTLKAIFRDSPLPLPLDRVLTYIRPVAAGLAYAHAQGVLHRDIKPSNVICANDGHIYIMDFGLARIAQAGESTMSQDMLIGTPQYISPEQARGTALDERTDIYSLGVVLFEMLTGRVPFSADTPYAIIHDHIYSPLPLPTTINPHLASEIERVLLKALAKDPDARFASATELMRALDAAQIPGAVQPITPPIVVSEKSTDASSPSTPEKIVPIATPIVPAKKAAQSKEEPGKKPARQLDWRTCLVVAVAALVVLIACGVFAVNQVDDLQRLLGRPTPAIDSVRVARERVTANPQDANAHLRYADALAAQKQFDAARAEYEQAIKLDPQLVDAYLRAGDLNLDQKRYEDARALYDRVLRNDPNNAQAIWRMGEYYRVQGKTVEALREFTRAITIDPNLPEAHYGLGMLALQRGVTEEARRQFQLVVNNPKTPPDLREEATKQLRALDKK